MKRSSTRSLQTPVRRSFGWAPPAALCVALASLSSAVSAAVCNYGENFDFPAFTASATSATGTMTNLDIDRQVATVTVTRTGGGNLPSAHNAGNTSTSYAGDSYTTFSPALSISSTLPYGRPYFLTGTNGAGNTPAADNEAPLTFTFNKSMRNLVMHFDGGDNKLYTFTDENGNPLEIGLYRVAASVTTLGSIPTAGTGASSVFFVKTATNQVAIGEAGSGTIVFKNPVSVIKMTQTYIRNTLTAANLNTTASLTDINFGQYCDQVGVVDGCNNFNFALWETATTNPTLHADPDSFAGRIIDETYKVVNVTYSGGLQTSATTLLQGMTQSGSPITASEGGITPAPYRPAAPLIQPTGTATGAAPVTFTWTFSEEVRNPGLMFRQFTATNAAGSLYAPGNLRFYKADGVTPLAFVLRTPIAPDVARQVDSNTLWFPMLSGSGSELVQFTESTSAIVAKFTQSTFPGDFKVTMGGVTVFMGCNGTMTAAGSTLDADSDGDGVSDLTDKCPNTPAGAVVGSDGCPLPTDLSIVKTASVTKITPGVPFTYTITVTNTGAEATNVKASDVVPAGLTINSISASDSGTTSQNGQSVQALWSIVPNGGVRTLTINVTKP